jgi:hypothetical protein
MAFSSGIIITEFTDFWPTCTMKKIKCNVQKFILYKWIVWLETRNSKWWSEDDNMQHAEIYIVKVVCWLFLVE